MKFSLKKQFTSFITKILEDFKHERESITIKDKDAREKYNQKRLAMIRDNWKALILLFKVIIVIVIVALSIDEQSSSLFMVRTSILFLLFLTCIFFQRIVQKYDWAAKNAGVIFICILVAANTEVNVNLGQYRVYEGFITQIAISFVFST